MTTIICRSPIPAPCAEGGSSQRLAGQVAAVDLLSKLAASRSNADAPDLFIAAAGEVIALAVAGELDAAEERLQGLARILGPAIRDGVVVRRDMQ